MNSENGRDIQAKAEHAREAGNFVDALKYSDEATVAYTHDKDLQGLAEVIGSRLLTFRHLYESSGNENYLILANHNAMACVEIAEKSGIKEALSMPYFNLGKAYESAGDLPNALDAFKKAIETKQQYPGELHNRVGVVADMKGHLAMAEYNNGDHDGLQRALEALADLSTSDEPQYNKDVWMSGAHMRIAEAVYHANSGAAAEHITKAEEIINSNPELVLRKKQIEKLKAKLT